MNNRTIDEIVQKRPYNKDSLLKINGMGPKKVMRFGQSILEAIISSGS
jgi:superfamily II DNA helicase RecQ